MRIKPHNLTLILLWPVELIFALLPSNMTVDIPFHDRYYVLHTTFVGLLLMAITTVNTLLLWLLRHRMQPRHWIPTGLHLLLTEFALVILAVGNSTQAAVPLRFYTQSFYLHWDMETAYFTAIGLYALSQLAWIATLLLALKNPSQSKLQ